MQTYTCDRCGLSLGRFEQRFSLTIVMDEPFPRQREPRVDLCMRCRCALDRWLTTPPEPNPPRFCLPGGEESTP
jgi:hypothetical protein